MTTKLTCGATECVHNISNLCSARRVHVGGITSNASDETQCDTFSPKGVKNAFSSLGNMNVTGEFKQIFSKDDIKMTPEVGCSAEQCIYNTNRICSATDITINGSGAKSSDGTQCETFRKE
ncbi:DUF1540 domain-containing protein [Clostridium sediminicola]|uniref:DUF1540 domain-containing protein n=1 Tax=Clostridium sediminicola TaxID=3114879 RepID=UPI0031F20A02